MAKATTFLATDPAGVVHKRTSQNRTYTHTVVVKLGRAYAERELAGRLERTAKQAPEDYDFHLSMIDGSWYLQSNACRDHLVNGVPSWMTPEARAKEVAQHTAELADRPVEQYVADKLAAVRAAHEERLAKGVFDSWRNIGWCGRLDLARKLAAKPPYIDTPEAVMILEATVKV